LLPSAKPPRLPLPTRRQSYCSAWAARSSGPTTPDARRAGYFDPVPGFAGAVDGALAGAPEPDPVVVGGFVELAFVVGALVCSDAIWWLPVL
jgi:hypothetical protein